MMPSLEKKQGDLPPAGGRCYGAGLEFDYEGERLDPAIAYYEDRGARSKRRFYVVTATQLVASMPVTALAAWPAERLPRPLLAVVSAAAALAAGLVGLFGWQQQWIPIAPPARP